MALKTLFQICTLSAVMLSPAWAHDPTESRVAIELESKDRVDSGTIKVEFQLVDTKLKKVVTDANLNVTHEKKLHMFMFDPALVEFRHEHPTFANGKWSVSVTLPVDGKYWLWVQGELSADKSEFTSSSRISVTHGRPANSSPPRLGDVRVGTAGVAKVTLTPDALRVGKMAMPDLIFSRTDGAAPVLTPYLGELAHVVAVIDDGDELVHVHPMNHGKPNTLMMHVVFPAAGEYRLWVQFIEHGELKVVPLSVRVSR